MISSRSLNKAQHKLLNRTLQQGMTPLLIHSGNIISQTQCDAVYFLIHRKGMTPAQALDEVNQLSSDQARLLIKYFDIGFNRIYILGNNISSHLGNGYFSILDFLIRVKKIPPNNVIDQLKDLDDIDLCTLLDFYNNGLRSEDIKRLKQVEEYQVFRQLRDKAHRERVLNKTKYYVGLEAERIPSIKFKYFNKVLHASIRAGKSPHDAMLEACHELCQIRTTIYRDRLMSEGCFPGFIYSPTKRRDSFLCRHVDDGIRSDDVSVNFFSPNRGINRQQRATYRYVLFRSHHSIKDALNQIHDLDDIQLKILRKYYKKGVTNELMRNFPHKLKECEYFINAFQWSPAETIANLKELTSDQLKSLASLVPSGLDYEQAVSLQYTGIFSDIQTDVVHLLMAKNGYDIMTAVRSVIDKSDHDTLEFMRQVVSENASTQPVRYR